MNIGNLAYARRVPDLAAPLSVTSPQLGGRLSIFLSHSVTDLDHVTVVQRQIEALGVDVYLAEHDPHPGTSIAGRIEGALRASQAVVFLVTTNSIDSAYVNQEVGLARAYSKPMVPIIDKRVDKTRLGMLTEVEWLEIDLDQPAEALARVTQSLQPLVRAQLLAQAQPSLATQAGRNAGNSALDTLVLMGLGLLLGLLIASVAFNVEANGS